MQTVTVETSEARIMKIVHSLALKAFVLAVAIKRKQQPTAC